MIDKDTFGAKKKSEKQQVKQAAANRTSMNTHYEEFRHPNMMTTVSNDILIQNKATRASGVSGLDASALGEKQTKGCAYYFKKFDE